MYFVIYAQKTRDFGFFYVFCCTHTNTHTVFGAVSMRCLCTMNVNAAVRSRILNRMTKEYHDARNPNVVNFNNSSDP